MDLTVTGLGNKPDEKAKLVFTTVVGGDGGLEIRGDIGAVGAPLYLDLAGEIRDLELPPSIRIRTRRSPRSSSRGT